MQGFTPTQVRALLAALLQAPQPAGKLARAAHYQLLATLATLCPPIKGVPHG
jgi:hypothetical protein